MIRSSERSDLESLEKDVPTTAADTLALRQALVQPMSGDEYLAFLASLGHAPREVLAARPILTGEPFVLDNESALGLPQGTEKR